MQTNEVVIIGANGAKRAIMFTSYVDNDTNLHHICQIIWYYNYV